MKKYITKLNDKNCIELSKPISTILVYKLPYKNVKAKDHNVEISNRFIVYILFGRNEGGQDVIYVGKSKNNIDHRPTSHEDKYDNWTDCYVITDIKERTILNDGTIQYLEDNICNQINETGRYDNKTCQTNSGTANHSDMEDCNEFLKEAYDMLYTLGLDLLTIKKDAESRMGDENQDDRIVHTIRPKMQPLYDRLIDEVKKLNCDIELTPMKVYIKGTIESRHLFDISSGNEQLIIYFNAKYGELRDPHGLLKDVRNIGHHGNGDYRIKIKDDSKLQEIIDFINQVINL